MKTFETPVIEVIKFATENIMNGSTACDFDFGEDNCDNEIW